MNFEEKYNTLAGKVREMRAVQKLFFSTRDRVHVGKAKQLEKEVDQLLENPNQNVNKTLFDGV